ncbi:MAG: Sua5/YciO/YrdC/YwlC family protein [Ureaplasma sp.]|nr:Sua5/YciO/YrdC/YwlC family protein [Ureaplasma sp.]
MQFKKYSTNDFNIILLELKNLKAAVVNTDTIYGIISVDTSLIYKVKQRSHSKKIITFINDLNLIPDLNQIQIDFLKTFWPGGITIIKDSISYRMPNDEFILKLLDKLNILYCSSANISNYDVIQNIDDANLMFDVSKHFYDLFLIDNKIENKSNIASTIVDIDKWKIIRYGHRFNDVEQYIDNLRVWNLI